jgi:polyribonucleotide nucleotidyltransferase
VKVIEVDKSGKIRLSRKALLPVPEGYVPGSSGGGDRGDRGPRRDDRGGRGGRGGGGRGGDRDRGPRPE